MHVYSEASTEDAAREHAERFAEKINEIAGFGS